MKYTARTALGMNNKIEKPAEVVCSVKFPLEAETQTFVAILT